MADRVLTWFIPDSARPIKLPRYYADGDYEKIGLRVYAEEAPYLDDLSIDIQADGVSIFQNTPTETFGSEGYRKTSPSTTPVLNKGENESLPESDLNGELIAEGQWVTLSVPDLKGATGVSIHLELNRVDQDNSGGN